VAAKLAAAVQAPLIQPAAILSGYRAVPLELPEMRQDSMSPSDRFLIRIADITCAVSSADPALRMALDECLHKFLVHAGQPDVVIEAKIRDLSAFKDTGALIFDSGAVWRLYQQNGTCSFYFQSPSLGPAPYKIARMHRDFTQGEILLHGSSHEIKQSIYPLEYPLDELLFINFLSLARGAEVHACGLVDSKGTGRLFLGQSTAGKTTMGRLWEDDPGVTTLSDDRIILRKIDNQIWMYGTPWHGEAGFAAPTQAPLNQVYFLQKGMRNQISSLKEAESASRFFACCFPLFYNRDAVDFTLRFFGDVAKNVPCYELSFLPDKTTVEFLLKVKD
jgi:hypothetical protein